MFIHKKSQLFSQLYSTTMNKYSIPFCFVVLIWTGRFFALAQEEEEEEEDFSSAMPSDMPSLVPSAVPSMAPTTATPSLSPSTLPTIGEPNQQTVGDETVEVVRPLVVQAGQDDNDNDNNIQLIGITQAMGDDNLVIQVPDGTQPGDLLVMFLHRTDDYLPWTLPEPWERKAWCFKENNHYNCAQECSQVRPGTGAQGETYCWYFPNPGTWGNAPPAYGAGYVRARDLAQAVFVREVTSVSSTDTTTGGTRGGRLGAGSSPTRHGDHVVRVDFGGLSSNPAWITLVTLRGANNTDPVRDWAATGADMSVDSIFPSVTGYANDVILLSQSFDDEIRCEGVDREQIEAWLASEENPQCQGSFLNPNGTQLLSYVSGSDETSFLWGGVLTASVSRNEENHDGSHHHVWQTEGPGMSGFPWGPPVKDLLISMTIQPSN